MRIDYPNLELLHAQARRQRAEAVYQRLIAPLLGLFRKRPTASLRSRLA